MLTLARNRRFGLLGTLIVLALGLFAVAFPLSSAKAQACWGVDLGGACVGLIGPGYRYNYNYYGYPYYGYPYYYGYPAYSYPYYNYPYYWYP